MSRPAQRSYMLSGKHEGDNVRFIPNQRLEFTPPGGSEAIVIWGLQDYSPRQTPKSDVWRLMVPAAYVGILPDGTEFSSFGQVSVTLARAFCGGDQAMASALISGGCGR